MTQHPVFHAATAPGRLAVIEGGGMTMTYGELDARSNQVAQLIRSVGLTTGSTLAILLENRAEYLEICWGAFRSGLHLVPVNTHLSAAEIAYIVDDCGADVLFGSSALLAPLGDLPSLPRERRIALGEPLPEHGDYERLLAAQPAAPVADESEGSFMLYSSGTTGRPKGIRREELIGQPLGAQNAFSALMSGVYGVGPDSVYLTPAPLYHAAPIGWTTGAHRLGATTVLMARFDPLETLALIERHRVTHVQFVPTHMIRMLRLSQEERSRFDLSSLQVVVHAAAPCPVEVKRAFIDWVGPIVHEYYSGSEGAGFSIIGPEEWLTHPGSVGRPVVGVPHILDSDGIELPNRQEGEIWFEGAPRFEYHGDREKTRSAFNDRGWASLGDMGWVDDEGYLYLTDRVSNMVISGGVNIYPREIEDVFALHPEVADVAVIGIADPDFGEAVRAVIQPASPVTDANDFAADLMAYCRERLSRFKCPTSFALIDAVPRLPTGKLAKRMLPEWVREPFPEGQLAASAPMADRGGDG